jgi:hypothetical protein
MRPYFATLAELKAIDDGRRSGIASDEEVAAAFALLSGAPHPDAGRGPSPNRSKSQNMGPGLRRGGNRKVRLFVSLRG